MSLFLLLENIFFLLAEYGVDLDDRGTLYIGC